MQEKNCSKCKTIKSIDEFSKKGAGFQPWCKLCNSQRSKQYYIENKDKHIGIVKAQRRDRIKEIKIKVFEYLGSHPCVDCGIDNILVLEFDHINPVDKFDSVIHMVMNGYGWDKVLEEINKCEVRCANCHRIKTSQSNGNFKFGYMAELSNALAF